MQTIEYRMNSTFPKMDNALVSFMLCGDGLLLCAPQALLDRTACVSFFHEPHGHGPFPGVWQLDVPLLCVHPTLWLTFWSPSDVF